MAYDEKAKERTMRYMKEKRDKLTLNLPQGDKERYKAHADKKGITIFFFIFPQPLRYSLKVFFFHKA